MNLGMGYTRNNIIYLDRKLSHFLQKFIIITLQ